MEETDQSLEDAENVLLAAMQGTQEKPEPDEDQEEVEADDAPEVEETDEGEDWFEIVVDGEQQRLSRSEAVKRLQLSAAAEKRFEEAKAAREQAKREAEQWTQRSQQAEEYRQRMEAQIGQLEGMMGEAPKPPTLDEFDRDPIGAQRRQLEVQSWYAKMQQIQRAREDLQRQRQQEQQAFIERKRSEEVAKFEQAHPEFDREKDLPRVLRQVQKQGYNPQVLANLGEGLGAVLSMAWKAEKYDEIQGNKAGGKPAPAERSANQPKVLKPSTSKGMKSNPKPRDDAFQKLRKTGSVDDAAAVLMASMTRR